MPHRCKSRPLPRRHCHLAGTRPRPGAGIRPRHRAGNPDPHAARRAAPLWPRSRNRFRGHGARRKTLARQTRPAQRPDRTGAVMILLLVVLWVTIPLLALVTFVQVLYLESLRLRTRDLPSLKFFKETLEDRIGIPTEDGAGAFSLVKHTLLCGLGILFFALFARPCVALLKFFQSLIDLTDDAVSPADEPTSAENIEALISAGTEEGLIEEEDRKLIQSVVEFGDKVVREVMTPRPNIVAISADATLEQLRQLVITEQYSRIPVYEQTGMREY